MPNEIEHTIAEKNIYLFSSLLRFEVEVNGKFLVVDTLVDLPDIFYSSRKNTNKLNCLKLGQKEILAALLDLIGEPVPCTRENSRTNTNPLDLGRDVELFARHLSLERMAFTISRNKTANPRLYTNQIKRLKNIADDIEAIVKDESIIDFQLLLDSIKEILSVL